MHDRVISSTCSGPKNAIKIIRIAVLIIKYCILIGNVIDLN